jgi:membrane-associated phospholipid phosphatase
MKFFLTIALIVLTAVAAAQMKPQSESGYEINRWPSAGIVAAGFTGNLIGLSVLDKKSRVSAAEAVLLSKSDVNSFDDFVFRYPSSGFDAAPHRSDITMFSSVVLPAALLLHKDFNSWWLDYSLLYFKTHAIGANIYAWGIPHLVDRYRPLVYYDDTPIGARIGNRKANSFFSGHVSTTATGSFFLATMIADNLMEKNKWIAYTAGALPPAFVALDRMRAGKHFPSDVITGFIIGGAVGILVPKLHRSDWREKRRNKRNLKAG